MNILFDTNILLCYIRKDSRADWITERYQPFDDKNLALISIVSQAELLSLSLQFGWGDRKNEILNNLINQFLVIPIEAVDLVKIYAEIDAFSQGKLKDKPLQTGMSARNMGKNDLWIAATAHITHSKLITTDHDFDHLDNVYLDLVRIPV
jgi:tRNA(fMet)-specific endonuclease VapC